MIFSPIKKDRGRPKSTVKEIIKRNLIVNIPENLVFNRTNQMDLLFALKPTIYLPLHYKE